MLLRLVEDICLCKLAQNNAEPKGNCYRLARRKTDQKSLGGSEFSRLDQGEGEIFRLDEDLTRMLNVADSIQLVQRIHYQRRP